MFTRRRWRSRPTKQASRKKMLFIIAIVATFFVVQSFMFVERRIREPLMEIAQIRIKQIATQAINKAITEQVSSSTDVQRLIDWQEDRNGKTTGFMLNYAEHMKITANAIHVVQDTLDELKRTPDSIPLGQALNSAILASYGPNVNVRFVPEGAVKVELNTRQTNEGINNVLVEVYLRVITEVSIIIPFSASSEVIVTELPISYMLVVGDVPMYYFDYEGQPMDQGGAIPLPPTISIPGSQVENMNP